MKKVWLVYKVLFDGSEYLDRIFDKKRNALDYAKCLEKYSFTDGKCRIDERFVDKDLPW